MKPRIAVLPLHHPLPTTYTPSVREDFYHFVLRVWSVECVVQNLGLGTRVELNPRVKGPAFRD